MIRLLCVIQGQVQGVGFRFFVLQLANAHQLTGWIRNMSNGMVEMELQGPSTVVQQVLRLIRQGERFIQVEDLSCKELPYNPKEEQFRILY